MRRVAAVGIMLAWSLAVSPAGGVECSPGAVSVVATDVHGDIWKAGGSNHDTVSLLADPRRP